MCDYATFCENWNLYNGFSRLMVIFDTDDQEEPRKGFLWFTADPLLKAIHVHIVSIEKSYQFQHFMEEHALPFLKDVARSIGFGKILYESTRGKAFERLGLGKILPYQFLELEV